MQVETTLYYFWYRPEWMDSPGVEVRMSDYLKKDPDYVLFDQKVIVHEVPDSPNLAFLSVEQIKNLNLKKQEVYVEAQKEVNEIDERIQSLLAIENKSEQSQPTEETQDDLPL